MPDTPIDYDKLSEALTKSLNAHGISGNKGGSAYSPSLGGKLGEGFDKVTTTINPLSLALVGASTSTKLAVAAFDLASGAIGKNIDTWRDLSASGASFSNDIVKMRVSAASTRLSLEDFSDIVKTSGASLSFLGGNVAKGAENFAKLSNAMFEGDQFRDTSDNLRGIGYTSKDLNQILALTVGFQRTSLQNTKESQDRAIAAAQTLATEMDKNAKLLGISRQEQEKLLEQAKLDSAVQARFKMIELTEGKEKAQAARDEYQKGLVYATATGTDALYKDLVANNGIITTTAAANQSALLGRQADGINDMAKATLKGNSEAMQAGMNKSMEGAVENDNNMSLLQMRTLGDLNKGVNDTLGTAAIKSQTMTDNIKARAEKDNIDLATARERVLADIGKGQKAGEGGAAPITEAAVRMESRLKDVQAGIAQGVAKPLTDSLAPNVKRISDKYLSATVGAKMTVGTNAAIQKASDIFSGNNAAPPNETTSNAILRNMRSSNDFISSVASNAGAVTGVTGKEPNEVPPVKSTLDDLNAQLSEINTGIKTVASQMGSMNDTADKQVRATKNLSNDRFRQ